MKFKYVNSRYKSVPITDLIGKKIIKVRLTSFDDILDQDSVFIIRTPNEQYLLTDYPSGTLTLMTKK